MKKILLIHGVNLNLLGKRAVSHYGDLTLADIEQLTVDEALKHDFHVIAYQSNSEGDLIDKLQSESPHSDGIIINPGAWSHYSYALYDALQDTGRPIVEVHLSKIKQREKWRKKSVTAKACIKVIWGKKEKGYIEAVKALVNYLKDK